MGNRVALSRQLRWRGRYLRKQTHRRAQSLMVSLPTGHLARKTLWICSWQRSGSTWLAEMMSSAPGTRLVYEPANLSDAVFDGPSAARVPLPLEGSPAAARVIHALSGHERGPWVDQLNRAHLVKRTVVKDVRAMGVAGEVREAVADTPVVILTRHPVAVARSVVSLGWTAGGADAFDREITVWCELHARAFADPRLADVHFVAYEALRAQPTSVLAGLIDYASTFDPTWRSVDLSGVDAARPSSTNFRSTDVTSSEEQWTDLPSELVARAADTLRTWGLDGLYNSDLGVRSEINEFVRRFRERSRGPST